MNIINISSSIEITPAQISFCEELCLYADNKNTDIDSYYQLSKKIPIFLVNAFEGEKGEGDKPSTDWLGYYKRSSCPPFENTPIIVICPERIAECVSSKDDFTWLFAKVLIHELSHARLDINNENILYVHTSADPIFYKWMEESTANMMTLRVFASVVDRSDWYKDSYSFVKDFITHQPLEYVLGGWLYDNEFFEWCTWREIKKSIHSKGCVKELWNDYVLSCQIINFDRQKISFLLMCIGIYSESLNTHLCENISEEDYLDITDLSFLFLGCRNLEKISKLKTPKAKKMTGMFAGCKSLKTIPVLDTENVTSMNGMFARCESLNNISDVLKYRIPEDYQCIFGIKEIDDIINKYKNRPQDKFKMIKELKQIDKKYK